LPGAQQTNQEANVSIRTSTRTPDGRRLWPTQEQAFEAQQRMAELLGIFSGVTKIADGYVLLYDPWPTLVAC